MRRPPFSACQGEDGRTITSDAASGNPTSARPKLWQREYFWLALIVLFAAALRCYNIRVPFIDTSDWRQTDTATIAYFYYHYGIALLHPQLWHDGPGPDYTQLEFQISPAVAALLAHIFGYSDVLLRAVAIAFYSLSIIPLWSLIRRHFGGRAALWAALCYSVLPVAIYFGRTFQPEPAMLFCGTLALWATDRFGERGGILRYLFAVATLSLAVLAKLPNAMILLPAVLLAYQKQLWNWREMLRIGRVIAMGFLALFPAAIAAAYTLVEGRIAGSQSGGSEYVKFIVTSLPQSYIAGSASLAHFVWHNIGGMAITPAGGILALIGLGVLARHRGSAWVWGWGFAILLYGVVVLRVIRFQYYLIPILPWLALLMGVGISAVIGAAERLPAVRWRMVGPIIAVCAVASILAGGLFEIQGYWPPYWPWYYLGLFVRDHTPPGITLATTNTYNPTVLYYAERHGFRNDLLPLQTLQSDMEGGATYLLDEGGVSSCLANYLTANFPHWYSEGDILFELAGSGVSPSLTAALERGTAPQLAGCS